MDSNERHNAVLAAHTAHLPLRTWNGQCTHERHGSCDSWQVQARHQHEAGVKLRAQLRAQGIVMPADLVWEALP